MIAMVELPKYWTIVRLNLSRGKWEPSEIPEAKEFLGSESMSSVAQTHPEEANTRSIQHQLWRLCRASEPSTRSHAALNLRCYISHAAKKTVDNLVNKIQSHDKNSLKNDLYQCVLNDEGKRLQFLLDEEETRLKFSVDEQQRLLILQGQGQLRSVSQPFSFKVLATFEPNRPQKLSLSNWTSRLVLQNSDVDQVLREYGCHRHSLWRFLSKVQPEQLRQMEQRFSNFTPEQINHHVHLLTILRTIHQQNRRQQRIHKLKGTPQTTKEDWMNQMLRILQNESSAINSSEDLLLELKAIAKFLIRCKTRISQPDSLDQKIDGNSGLERHDLIPCPKFINDLDELEQQSVNQFHHQIQQDFYPLYLQERLQLLDQSLEENLLNQLKSLQNSRSKKLANLSSHYLSALRDFYCSKRSMAEIASRLGLNYQYEVSRFLKLSNVLEDSRRQMLVRLQDFFFDWARNYAAVEHLDVLDEQPGIAIQLLDEEIEDILSLFAQAQAEKHNPDHSSNSLVAQRIRHFLNSSQGATHYD